VNEISKYFKKNEKQILHASFFFIQIKLIQYYNGYLKDQGDVPIFSKQENRLGLKNHQWGQ